MNLHPANIYFSGTCSSAR